jgi:hypothetical protein
LVEISLVSKRRVSNRLIPCKKCGMFKQRIRPIHSSSCCKELFLLEMRVIR